MGAASGRVKGGRRYDASSRRARAAERRDLVLRTAEEMFLRDGYAAVTVRALADATGTSQETIYKTYGGKAGLVAAIQEAALQGSGPVPAPERSDALSLGESDADVILRQWATLSMEVAPRVSPVMLLVRSSASTDAQMRELWDQMADRRRERMAHNADRLLATGQVRTELSRDDVRDVPLHLHLPRAVRDPRPRGRLEPGGVRRVHPSRTARPTTAGRNLTSWWGSPPDLPFVEPSSPLGESLDQLFRRVTGHHGPCSKATTVLALSRGPGTLPR